MSIIIQSLHTSPNQIITIENDYHRITLLSFAATLHDWVVKDHRGSYSIIMHPSNVMDSLRSSMHYGHIIGPTAGRLFPPLIIAGNTIELPSNGLLHGGPSGFSWQNFTIISNRSTPDEDILVMSAVNQSITSLVTFALVKDKLTITMDATTTRPTLVNLTYHPYFNLGSELTIASHTLHLPSQGYVTMNQDYRVNGLAHLTERMNFNSTRTIISEANHFKGYDDYWQRDKDLSPIVLSDSRSRRSLIIESSLPYCVVYTHNVKSGITMDRGLSYHGGVAIEPQLEPYALSQPTPSSVLEPDQTYHHFISYQFVHE